MSRLGTFWRTNTMTIAIVVMVVAFGTILFLQAAATSKLQQQTKQQTQIIGQIKGVTDQLNGNSKLSTQQIQNLNAHIDCIVTFFSTPDRSNTAIQDINTCTLKNSNTGTTTAPTQTQKTSSTSTANPPTNTSLNNSAATPVAATPTVDSSTPSGGSSTTPAPFLQRVIVNPIKSIINAL